MRARARMVRGEPGANHEPSVGAQDTRGLREELPDVRHVLGAFDCDRGVERFRGQLIFQPIAEQKFRVRIGRLIRGGEGKLRAVKS